MSNCHSYVMAEKEKDRERAAAAAVE